MKNLLLIFFAHFTFYSISQEQAQQITQLDNLGTGVRLELTKIGDSNYVNALRNDDMLSVFVENSGNLSFLHERRIPGIAENYTLQSYGKYLMGKQNSGSFAYDIVNDTLIEFPFESDHRNSRFTYLNERDVFLRHDNGFNGTGVLIDFETMNIDDLGDEVEVLDATNRYLHIRKSNEENTSHHIIHRVTGDTLFTHPEMIYNSNFLMDGINFVYLDGQELKYFNFEAEESTSLFSVYDMFAEVKISKVDSMYIVYSKDTNNKILIYNSFFELLSEIEINGIVREVYPQILSGSIYLLGHDYTYSVDVQTFGLSEYDSEISALDGYLVAQERFVFSKVGNRLQEIDLLNKTSRLLEGGLFDGRFYRLSTITSSNGISYLNFDDRDEQYQSLYELTEDEIQPTGWLEEYTSGISNKAELLRCGDQLVLIQDQSIYRIDGEEVTRVNISPALKIKKEEEISNHRYNRITWLEQSEGEVVAKSLSNAGIKMFGPISTIANAESIQDYSVGSSTMYFVFPDVQNQIIYAVEQDETDAYSVEGLSSWGWSSLYTYDNDLYIIQSGELFYKNGNESENIKKLSVPSYVVGPIIYEENIFFVSEKGMYKILDGEAIEVINEDINSIGSINTGKYLVKTLKDTSFALYDNDQYESFSLDYPYYWYSLLDSTNLILDNIFYPEAPILRFDMDEKEFTTMEGDIANKKILKRFTMGQQDISVVANQIYNPNKLEFYISNDQFTEFTFLTEIPIWNASFPSFSWVKSGENVLCYSENDIFYFTPELQVEKIEGLKGETINTKFIELNGYYYFVAIGDGVGRQVWRVKNETINSTLNPIVESLEIFPNPAQNWIKLNNASAGDRFELTSISGTFIKNGLIDKSKVIDLKDLATGMYVLTLNQDSKIKSCKLFVEKL